MDLTEYKHTHTLSYRKTKVVDGRVIKEGSKGSRKVVSNPENRTLTVQKKTVTRKKGKVYRESVCSTVVGAPKKRATRSYHEKAWEAEKMRQKRLINSIPVVQENDLRDYFMTTPQMTPESEETTTVIYAPDGSAHNVILSELYPV